MKPNVSLPLIGLIGATRAMAGAGLALLLADHVKRRHRKRLGAALFGIGALSTIPLALTVLRRSRRRMGTYTEGGVMEPQSEVYKPSYGIIDADIEMPDLEPGLTSSSVRP
jgi:hypothetical protein